LVWCFIPIIFSCSSSLDSTLLNNAWCVSNKQQCADFLIEDNVVVLGDVEATFSGKRINDSIFIFDRNKIISKAKIIFVTNEQMLVKWNAGETQKYILWKN
jgi:hypothetical protein